MVRRRAGGDFAAEEGRTEDDVWLGGCEKREEAGHRAGLALVVAISRAVQCELELVGRGHAEEGDASVE